MSGQPPFWPQMSAERCAPEDLNPRVSTPLPVILAGDSEPTSFF